MSTERNWPDVLADLRRFTTVTQTPERRAVLALLARADGQDLDGFDLGHTAEIMYGREANALIADVSPAARPTPVDNDNAQETNP